MLAMMMTVLAIGADDGVGMGLLDFSEWRADFALAILALNAVRQKFDASAQAWQDRINHGLEH